MTSVVCCVDAFSAGKSRKNREKNRSEQSVARRTMFPRQVSRILNVKATVRYKADDVPKAG